MKYIFPFGLQAKRFCALICAMVLCLSLAACSSEEPSKDNSNAKTTTSGEKEPAAEQNAAPLLTCTYKVPIEEIYIDVPEYREMNGGYTEVFMKRDAMDQDAAYVTFTTDRRATAENAKASHEINLPYFLVNMDFLVDDANYLTIEKEEVIEINGMEVYAFEGTLNCGEDKPREQYAKGYAFVFNGIPCEIIGSVIDDAQPEELITEISTVLDAMIKTVRNTPEI